LVAKSGRKHKHPGKPKSDEEVDLPEVNVMPDLFDAKPGEALSSDICYIRDKAGDWVYVCGILDVGQRELVGYWIEPHMRKELVIKAIKSLPEHYRHRSALFHNDNGKQYMAKKTQELLKENGFRVSRSRPAHPMDNQPIESFWNTMKREANLEGKSREEIEAEVRRYITYYNTKRLHSALGYRSPQEVRDGLPPRGEQRQRKGA
jgi:transposase InsO family protein